MLKQFLKLTSIAVAGSKQRLGSSIVVILGMAGVVGVMVSLLAMANGFKTAFGSAGRPDRAIVLRSGDPSGMTSGITQEQVPLIVAAEGIARDRDGEPLVVMQKFMFATLPLKKDGSEVTVVVRGVGEKFRKVWPGTELSSGRWFRPGIREIVVGRLAAAQFAGIELGKPILVGDVPWTVVGFFAAEGSVLESEIWADAMAVLTTYSVTRQFSSAIAMVESIGALKKGISENPALSHSVESEIEYYTQQADKFNALMRKLGVLLVSIMAFGALFSALNTMYAAVSARALEVATLRAIGFSAAPVILSVLAESIILCSLGAALGLLAAALFFDGYVASTPAWSTGGEVVFAFHLSGSTVAYAIICTCLIAVTGGIVPALRAGTAPIAEALRRSANGSLRKV